jgi:hypothetical protein
MLCLIVEDLFFMLSYAYHPGANELLKPLELPERLLSSESREITC